MNTVMYDTDHHKSIKTLLDLFGEAECLRLEFLDKDDNATLCLSPAGMGYLIDVLATELETPHEAYAAGYQQGYTQGKEGL